jgi:hypothetical protein
MGSDRKRGDGHVGPGPPKEASVWLGPKWLAPSSSGG